MAVPNGNCLPAELLKELIDWLPYEHIHHMAKKGQPISVKFDSFINKIGASVHCFFVLMKVRLVRELEARDANFNFEQVHKLLSDNLHLASDHDRRQEIFLALDELAPNAPRRKIERFWTRAKTLLLHECEAQRVDALKRGSDDFYCFWSTLLHLMAIWLV